MISLQELLASYRAEVEDNSSGLSDFYEGSINDILAGVMATAVHEAMTLITDQFLKTFIDTAHGPEVTGGPDDLQTLAVDHFGSDFARPGAQKAEGIVTFSRPTTGAGDVLIPAGTIVKTEADANGQVQSYVTVLSVTMTGLSINASVEAITAGASGNAGADEVTVIESALTDGTIVVTNDDAFSGGAPAQDDATYRQTIRNLIAQLRGATIAAIEARAKTVSGVVKATGYEFEQTVIEWNPAEEEPIGEPFKIARGKLYVADANGTANDALLASVKAAIAYVRAAGVFMSVEAAEALSLNWTASITLNPGGPNYATLETDTTMIEDSMRDYIEDLPIGTGFDRILAKAAIMAIWGPSGSNDISDFSISAPTGNVAAAVNQKLVPGTMTV